MEITIGLDFGTHQTKVCVEDAADKINKRYTFFQFTLNGRKSLVLPSLVQLNKDGTLSYGAFNNDIAETFQVPAQKIPEFHFPVYVPAARPEPPQMEVLPKPPVIQNRTNDFKSLQSLLSASSVKTEYEVLYNSVKVRNELKSKSYFESCKKYEAQELENKTNWQNSYDQALSEYRALVDLKSTEVHLFYQFRNFKTAALGDNRYWDFIDIDPKEIAVLYLCNVLFLVEDVYGENVFVQMGVPQTMDAQGAEISKSGLRLLYTARKLKQLFETHEDFLGTPYEFLKTLIERPNHIGFELRYKEGIEVLPEAYAGLLALTNQRRIPNGFSLLVDIGGGTTDVALFTLAKERRQPDIAKVVSINGGLNSILAQVDGLSVPEVQDFLDEVLNRADGRLAQSTFTKGISKKINELIAELYREFEFQGLNRTLGAEALNAALKSRQVYYSGGGGVFAAFRQPVGEFTEVVQVSLKQMDIPGVSSELVQSPFDTILAVAYGLSISRDDIDPPSTTTIADLLRPLGDNGDGIADYKRDFND